MYNNLTSDFFHGKFSNNRTYFFQILFLHMKRKRSKIKFELHKKTTMASSERKWNKFELDKWHLNYIRKQQLILLREREIKTKRFFYSEFAFVSFNLKKSLKSYLQERNNLFAICFASDSCMEIFLEIVQLRKQILFFRIFCSDKKRKHQLKFDLHKETAIDSSEGKRKKDSTFLL